MNVKELITELNKVEDKDKEVYGFIDGDIFAVTMVDLGISDRVDLNIDYGDN